jgi:hypothetical protein
VKRLSAKAIVTVETGAGIAGLQAIATARRLKPVFKKGTRLRPTVTSAVMADTAPVCRIQEFRHKFCAPDFKGLQPAVSYGRNSEKQLIGYVRVSIYRKFLTASLSSLAPPDAAPGIPIAKR